MPFSARPAASSRDGPARNRAHTVRQRPAPPSGLNGKTRRLRRMLRMRRSVRIPASWFEFPFRGKLLFFSLIYHGFPRMQPDDINFLRKTIRARRGVRSGGPPRTVRRSGMPVARRTVPPAPRSSPRWSRGAADGQAFQDRDLDLRERLAGLRGDEAVPAVHGRAVHDDRQKMQGKRSGARRRAVSIHGGVESLNQFAVDCLPGDAVSIHGGVEAAMECQFKTKSRKKRKKTWDEGIGHEK